MKRTNQRSDADFLRDPDSWPHWPGLPMINRTTREPGIVCMTGDSEWTLLKGANIWLPETHETAEIERFTDPQDIVNAGWRID